MCDVFNKFSLTYYSDVSQFSRRSFSNPVPERSVHTCQESRRMSEGGEKKERSLVG